jgi:formylglycine-generating enzyme required for sulfatase activity
MVCAGVSSCAEVIGVDSLENSECTENCGFSPTADAAAADANEMSDSGAEGGCPGTAGPTSVAIQPPSAAPFCIDATEVTNADYATFLAAGSNPQLDGACKDKTSFEPSSDWPVNRGRDPFPVVYVDWCDAVAYCEWAGKSLCGTTGSGDSRWVLACGGATAQSYPYGSSYMPGTCNDHASSVAAVGSDALCVGGYEGIMDMSGNVAEWDTDCTVSNGNDVCAARGGAFDTTWSGALQCGAKMEMSRLTGFANVGFRCCSP